MDRFQSIYDIAELCARKGLTHAVLAPGSRCAPLTLAFTRHKKIKTKTISDERSAGFIGLGMAQQSQTPVVLLCTSGTAAYNFAPAVAEAFFSNTPLIVFTADRPAEWIDQQDGQAIYQGEIFGKHIKKFFQLPQDYEHSDSRWAINRMVNEAVNLAQADPKGPVHINAPFREPLYPAEKSFKYSKNVRVIESYPSGNELTAMAKTQLQKDFFAFRKILVVAGQHAYDSHLITVIRKASQKHNLPVAGDVVSNLHPIGNLIKHADLFLGQATEDIKQSLQPDLLITFGGQVISKNLKLFLRTYSPQAHWHIQPAGTPADTFQHLTRIIHTTPALFFSFLKGLNTTNKSTTREQRHYQTAWASEEKKTAHVLQKFFPQPDSGELQLVKQLLEQLPQRCNLHLANSMSVRYANFIGLSADQKQIRVYANRGTSGIDGCTSTAVGHSLVDEVPNVLITGDMAFFYDRNAFWNNYSVPKLRVAVLNNHGGIIFNLIDGPSSLPESREYFVTDQKLTAKKLCEEFKFEYLNIGTRQTKNMIKDFFTFKGNTKILEFESGIEQNKIILDNLKQKIKKSYEL